MTDDETTTKRELPVVAIGASARGVHVFEALFAGLPADTGAAFVIVQHLAPDTPSQLPEIIARHTQMPVQTVNTRTRLTANTVYITLPDQRLATQYGAIFPAESDGIHGHNAPIDHLFRSLAESHGLLAAGVVLSGTGEDGALGIKAIKAIKAAGGLTLAQQPDSAASPGMPRSAVTAHVIDHVVELDRIGPILKQHFSQMPQPADGSTDVGREQLNAILDLLRTHSGRNFQHYKRNMVSRRIVRRMDMTNTCGLPAYRKRLETDANELDRLYHDLLISVTDFFRDPDAYDALATKVLPQILQDGDGPLRIWVPACATGEEAYSLAILAHEAMETHNASRSLQIFATDIDKRAVDVARTGLYPRTIEADVSAERLHRFFETEDHHYRVGGLLRESVTFATQDVTADPPYSRLHLISCRNLLIYLDEECQARVCDLFHFALHDGGYLFLGRSETVGHRARLFHLVDTTHRLYQRCHTRRHGSLNFPAGVSTDILAPSASHLESGASIDRQAQELLLREYVVPSALVDPRGEVICTYGAIGDYMALPTGQVRMDLLQMVTEDIRHKLRTALFKARQGETHVRVTVTREHSEGGTYALCISVRPLQEPQALQGLCLVTFESTPTHVTEAAADTNQDAKAESFLTEELSNTEAALQQAMQTLEVSNQELQSSNEELDTSKEELQSANEELSTVNAELRDKINELECVNDDLANLFAGLDAGVLFLDRNLCIKRFTPAVRPLINLIDSDLGRSLRDIQLRFEDANLLTEADAVLQDLKRRETEVVAEGGNRYLRRVLPYRTGNNHVEGVVITFTEITELTQALSSARQSDEQLRLLANTLPVLIAFVDNDHRFTFAMGASATWLGLNPETLQGMRVDEALGSAYDEHMRRHVEAALHGHQVAFETEFNHREFGKRHVNIIFVPETFYDHDNRRGFHVLVTDITQYRRHEAERVEEQMEFNRTSRNISLNEMASMITHQINQPLGAISSYTGALRRQLANAGEQPQELVDKIGTQVQAASDIVRDLRSFIGDRATGDDPMDINALVRRVLTLTETHVEEAGVAVQLDLTAGPPQPRGSRVQIEQVLLNLIGNALEAMESSHPARLTLSTHHVDAHAEIRVHDTGDGIDQAHLNQLFDPFFSTKENNMGMGLAICRTIVEDHGGRLWAESYEAGSVFVVRLPESEDTR